VHEQVFSVEFQVPELTKDWQKCQVAYMHCMPFDAFNVARRKEVNLSVGALMSVSLYAATSVIVVGQKLAEIMHI